MGQVSSSKDAESDATVDDAQLGSRQRAGKQQVCGFHFLMKKQAALCLCCATGTEMEEPSLTAALTVALCSPCPPHPPLQSRKSNIGCKSKKVRALLACKRLYQRCQMGNMSFGCARALQAMPSHCSFTVRTPTKPQVDQDYKLLQMRGNAHVCLLVPSLQQAQGPQRELEEQLASKHSQTCQGKTQCSAQLSFAQTRAVLLLSRAGAQQSPAGSKLPFKAAT